MTELIRELPAHYAHSPQDAELQRALGLLVDQLQADKARTLRQLHPSTASGWGLELWERAYGIAVDDTQPEERRRARVLAKVKGVGVTTVERLLGIASAFSASAVEIVEFFDQYRFEIWYTETIGPVRYPDDLAAMVNELKPAHLAWDVKYRQTVPAAACAGTLERSAEYFILRQQPMELPKWPVDVRAGTAGRQAEKCILKQG
ncbi:putative phage tail protein [uncultured Intestinimonas sp.]|uniref:putative phage tail protein n=1 Tax=uncultured Intestinimonas sp. TaxID=1689265 RepID=UPI0029420952|nr:putative phage tail protein [uncultured Intestinimonas sp.]